MGTTQTQVTYTQNGASILVDNVSITQDGADSPEDRAEIVKHVPTGIDKGKEYDAARSETHPDDPDSSIMTTEQVSSKIVPAAPAPAPAAPVPAAPAPAELATDEKIKEQFKRYPDFAGNIPGVGEVIYYKEGGQEAAWVQAQDGKWRAANFGEVARIKTAWASASQNQNAGQYQTRAGEPLAPYFRSLALGLGGGAGYSPPYGGGFGVPGPDYRDVTIAGGGPGLGSYVNVTTAGGGAAGCATGVGGLAGMDMMIEQQTYENKRKARQITFMIQILMAAIGQGNIDAIQSALTLVTLKSKNTLLQASQHMIRAMMSYEEKTSKITDEMAKLAKNDPKAGENGQFQLKMQEMNQYSSARQMITNSVRDVMSMVEELSTIEKSVYDKKDHEAQFYRWA